MRTEQGRWELTAQLIDADLLRDYLHFRKKSYATLAREVTMLGAVEKPPVRCSKATVGHLATGFVKTTSPVRARLIEHVLDVKPGTLFLVKVSRVLTDTRRVA